MKLNFIINFNVKETDHYASEDDRVAPASSEYVRNENVHMHENYTDFGNFIIYRGFNDVVFRSRYEDFEHALIDVPDELVFQFMLLGIKDYDFIVYNHYTKRIIIGNDSYDLTYYSSTDEDLENLKRRSGGIRGCSSSNSSRMSERFFDFKNSNNNDCEDADNTEHLMFEIDHNNGYNDFLNVLKPYINHKFIKDVNLVARDLQYSDRTGGMPVPMDRVCTNNTVFNVPREDVAFVFLAFLNSDALWDDNERQFSSRHIEIIRQNTLLLWKKFTENTQDK